MPRKMISPHVCLHSFVAVQAKTPRHEVLIFVNTKKSQCTLCLCGEISHITNYNPRSMESSPYKRMAVISATSSGKSTLAKQVAKELSLDFVELDALHWEANWHEADDDVFRVLNTAINFFCAARRQVEQCQMPP